MNMDSDMLYLPSFDSNEEIFESTEKLVLTVNKQAFPNLHKSLCEDAKKH